MDKYEYKIVANDEPKLNGFSDNLDNLGVGDNTEGKCAATVLVWGAGIGKEEVNNSMKSEQSPLMIGNSVRSSTLFLQKNINIKSGIQENRIELFGGKVHKFNMIQLGPSLKKILDGLQGDGFCLLRLRPQLNEEGSGHALGLRKLPPKNNDENPIFEIIEPNQFDTEKYKVTENAMNAVFEKVNRYVDLRLDSLEIYQVKTVRDKIKELLSNKKIENKACVLC